MDVYMLESLLSDTDGQTIGQRQSIGAVTWRYADQQTGEKHQAEQHQLVRRQAGLGARWMPKRYSISCRVENSTAYSSATPVNAPVVVRAKASPMMSANTCAGLAPTERCSMARSRRRSLRLDNRAVSMPISPRSTHTETSNRAFSRHAHQAPQLAQGPRPARSR